MFNDERINAECGKIYSKGILLTVLTTLVYVISRTVTLIIRGTLKTPVTYTEAVILILGIGILLIGAFRFKSSGDERIAFERHNYYQKAGKTFILAVFGTYILTIPFTTQEMLGGQWHNHLLMLLEVIGYLYIFYSFRTKEINFNYSFIAENGTVYFSRVFTIIGSLWLGLLIPFVLAAAWELILHRSLAGALTILLAYVSSAIGLSVEYFFISLTEKLSYNSTDSTGFAIGTKISMAVCLAVSCLSAGLQYVSVHFVTGNLQDIPNAGAVIAKISQHIKRMDLLLIILIGFCLCNVISQTKRSPLLYSVCRIKMVLLALSAFGEILMPVWFRAVSEETLRFLANNADPWMNLISQAISVVLWFLFVRAMIKELNAPRILWVIPPLHIVLRIVNVFFNSQSMLRAAVCCESIISIGCLILLTVVMWKYRGFPSDGEEEIGE